jgi:hypothetical protein
MGRFDAHEGECTKNPTPLFFHRFGRGRFGRGGVLGRFWGGFFSSKTAVNITVSAEKEQEQITVGDELAHTPTRTIVCVFVA